MIRLLPVMRLVTTWYFLLLLLAASLSSKFLHEYEHRAFKHQILSWTIVLAIDALRIWAGKSS